VYWLLLEKSFIIHVLKKFVGVPKPEVKAHKWICSDINPSRSHYQILFHTLHFNITLKTLICYIIMYSQFALFLVMSYPVQSNVSDKHNCPNLQIQRWKHWYIPTNVHGVTTQKTDIKM
jgi:hypothetical protein